MQKQKHIEKRCIYCEYAYLRTNILENNLIKSIRNINILIHNLKYIEKETTKKSEETKNV